MSIISISNLTFAHEGSYENIFENVSLNLDSSWKLGIIGRNGRGKTTFLKILLGEYKYKGRIDTKVDFEYFPFGVSDDKRFTEEIVYDINPNYEYWQIAKEFNLLDVDEEILYRSFDSLSLGERSKVMLAALFTKENSFLLIDDPTNHLDEEGREKLREYLSLKKGFILVSHDRNLLDNTVDHILSINKTGIEVQRGNFSSYFENMQKRDNYERTKNDRLVKEIGQLKEAARRTSGWSDAVEKTKFGSKNSGVKVDRGYVGHKSAKMMQRAKSINKRIDRAIEDKASLMKDLEKSEKLKIVSNDSRAGTLLRFKDVCLYYGEKEVVNNLSFSLNKGDRVILKGKNGSGKSTVLKLIEGKEIKHEGEVYISPNLKISSIPQDASFLKGNLRDFAFESGVDETVFKTNLRKLDFKREDFEKDISLFSSGEKKKVLIAKSLSERADLYIWDEPLNFIDVFSRIQIENLILEYTPTMIIVEHDKAFCDKVGSVFVDIKKR